MKKKFKKIRSEAIWIIKELNNKRKNNKKYNKKKTQVQSG
jgi:hypothetical protein